MINKSILKNFFIVIVIPVLGYILLFITFIFYALFHAALYKLFSFDNNMTVRWLAIGKFILFFLIIALISWLIFKSKIKNLYKAIYAVIPTSVVFVELGIFFYKYPTVEYILGTLVYGSIILYLYKIKKQWFFYYSVTLVVFILLMISILGVEI